MAYKILGQASAVTPSATITTNLVKDSSFRNLIGEGWLEQPLSTATISSGPGYTSGSGANQFYVLNINNNQHWSWAVTGTNSNQYITNTGVATSVTTAPVGTTRSSLGAYHTTSSEFYIGYGITNGQAPNTPQTSWLNPSTAIPVKGNTQYFAYFSFYQSANQSSAPTMRIWWFQPNGSIISTTPESITGSSVTGAWTRNGQGVTSPPNAAYAVFAIFFNSSGASRCYADGIYFGTNQAAGLTFIEPQLPSEAVITAPFDKKLNGYITESPVSTSAIQTAGSLQTLYTVPSTKETVISTISVANLSPVASTYRVAVIPSGATLAAKHFIHMDVPIAANSTQTITIGITLAQGDTIQVAADSESVSFSAFGSESA